jgi:hypothetical protein
MSRGMSAALLVLLFAVGVSAQVVYIDDSNPATGTSNTFPWAQANGFTTLHVYNAAQLTAGGVCPGATLLDVAVAPSNGVSGTYNAPQARLSIGHLANNPPIAGGWESNLSNPAVVHDLTSGPYTFPWTLNTWTPLPGVSTAGFVWDGVTSIAIFYTSSAGTTGLFQAHRTGTNLRHAVPIFNATNQAPTSNGLFAMKVRLTWTGGVGSYQANQVNASLDIDGIGSQPCHPAIVTRAIGVTANFNFASALTGAGWEVVFTAPEPMVTPGFGAITLPNSGQILNIDLSAPSVQFLNGLAFPPFPGNFAIPVSFPFPVMASAQMVLFDAGNPDGFALSGPVTLIVQ